MREQTCVRIRFLCWLVVGVIASVGCGGAGGWSATGADADAPEELPPDVVAAQRIVLGLQAEVLDVMREAPELGYLGRFERLEAVAVQSFDLPLMARQSYGAGFRELTPDQQRLWLETFERFHISSVADIRDRYSGQVYRLLGWERPTPDAVLIKSILDYPGRAVDIFIDYRVSERPQGWRIVDVHQPPAVSEVAMRRSEYRTLLERRGFDGLIAEMNDRVEQRRAR